jgi:hypothetical protein
MHLLMLFLVDTRLLMFLDEVTPAFVRQTMFMTDGVGKEIFRFCIQRSLL